MEVNERDVMLYFWNASCNVCGPLYDKLQVLVNDHFPQLGLQKINVAEHPELRAKYQVFSSPIIILLLDGKEYLRSSGNVSITEIRQKIDRLYALRFGE